MKKTQTYIQAQANANAQNAGDKSHLKRKALGDLTNASAIQAKVLATKASQACELGKKV
jgi:hypothetical protein